MICIMLMYLRLLHMNNIVLTHGGRIDKSRGHFDNKNTSKKIKHNKHMSIQKA